MAASLRAHRMDVAHDARAAPTTRGEASYVQPRLMLRSAADAPHRHRSACAACPRSNACSSDRSFSGRRRFRDALRSASPRSIRSSRIPFPVEPASSSAYSSPSVRPSGSPAMNTARGGSVLTSSADSSSVSGSSDGSGGRLGIEKFSSSDDIGVVTLVVGFNSGVVLIQPHRARDEELVRRSAAGCASSASLAGPTDTYRPAVSSFKRPRPCQLMPSWLARTLTSTARNFSGSSRWGACADFSNHTSSLLGAVSAS